MKIMTIGSAMRDIFIQHQNIETKKFEHNGAQECFVLLREGAKIEVDAIEYYTGGGATNSAISLSRLGFDVTTFCKVGNDNQANAITQELTQEKINTDLIIQHKKISTGSSFIIPCPSGNRTVLIYRGANITIEKKDIPFEQIKKMDQLYITSLSQKTSDLLLPITDFAKQQNIPVATNPGTSQLESGAPILKKCLANIDILILNAYEASLLGCSLHGNKNNCSREDYFKYVLDKGPRIAVVTDGANGVYVATQESTYFHPSIPTNVVSTLGAGDAFASCFVASILERRSITESLVRGIINSSSVIQYLDAKTGLLDSQELADRFTQIGINKIQKN